LEILDDKSRSNNAVEESIESRSESERFCVGRFVVVVAVIAGASGFFLVVLMER
jgi:hypothetical protein